GPSPLIPYCPPDHRGGCSLQRFQAGLRPQD
ncbi:hypothetical protein BN1723_019467, partial [Verticillium longisporum]